MVPLPRAFTATWWVLACFSVVAAFVIGVAVGVAVGANPYITSIVAMFVVVLRLTYEEARR